MPFPSDPIAPAKVLVSGIKNSFSPSVSEPLNRPAKKYHKFGCQAGVPLPSKLFRKIIAPSPLSSSLPSASPDLKLKV